MSGPIVKVTAWDKLLIAAVLMSAALSFFAWRTAFGAGDDGRYVSIRVAGKNERFISISRNHTKVIRGVGGWCRLRISNGKARIIASDCPKHLCLTQGPISNAGQSIICLPHRISVTVKNGNDLAVPVDAVTR